jgi:anti-sigma factor RsiW
MKTCRWIRDHIIEYFDGGLSGSVREDLLSHVSQCPQCRQEYERYARMYSLINEDEVVFPPDGVFERIKANARGGKISVPQITLRRISRILVPTLAAAAILLIILWPRNRTVEFSVPVATLLEDEDIASIAVAAVVNEDMVRDLAAIEYYLMPETEQAIDELTVDEKIEFVDCLHNRYPAGT